MIPKQWESSWVIQLQSWFVYSASRTVPYSPFGGDISVSSHPVIGALYLSTRTSGSLSRNRSEQRGKHESSYSKHSRFRQSEIRWSWDLNSISDVWTPKARVPMFVGERISCT